MAPKPWSTQSAIPNLQLFEIMLDSSNCAEITEYRKFRLHDPSAAESSPPSWTALHHPERRVYHHHFSMLIGDGVACSH
jgi:hypothetical protein